MGIFADAISAIFDDGRRTIRGASPEDPNTSLSNPAEWLVDWMTGGTTYAGPPVNELNAVRATAVFRCISIIANTIASLPFNVYKRTPDGRESTPTHPLQRILHDQPNRITSSYTFRQIIAGGLLTNGNGYAVIGRNNAGRILDLLQLPPQDVEVERKGSNGNFRIEYVATIDGEKFAVPQESMIHVPGFGFDGVKGISPIAAVGKQAIGLGLALEEFQGRFTAASARGSGVVEVDKGLSETGLKNLRTAFEKLYSGVEKSGKTVFLDKGQTWKSMQIDPSDAQTLETRRYQVSDIARIFGVPLHLLGETEKATSWGSGIEQQTIAFVEYVIRPWLVSIEQEFNRKLFRAPYYCEMALAGLLRGDSKSRADYYSKGVNNAFMTPNEARRAENLPPLDGGDRLFLNSAALPLDTVDERNTTPTAGATPPPIDEPDDQDDDQEEKE
jgi:HK97 family phage portal protein